MAISDLEKIRELEEKLSKEKKKLSEWNERPNDDYKLAELMHGMFCGANHTDGCSWFYETGTSHPARHDPWSAGYAHKNWLNKARKFKKTAARIQKTVKGKKGYNLCEALLKEWPRGLY